LVAQEPGLRKVLAAFVLATLAAVGAHAPASVPGVAAAAPANPKVVIIVGATHSVTSKYRTYANEVYAEAIKYSTNVVKVYSPNAPWSKVQSAVSGASIVVYLGHGNGWPSPYTYDPNYTTKDGFGLNATAGDGDYNNKYYGEPYIRTLNFAPNAVVLLFHLCYASGNSEPGNPEPTRSVAKQRADNYTAAFIRAGARAVIADGHSHSPYYIRSLFTTRQTIDQLWRNAPNFNNHRFSFESSRNPGYTIEMDPDGTSSGYYRSLGGKLSLRTEDVTGARYAATNYDPTSFVVPGNASVSSAAGAAFWQDPALSLPATPATLLTGTRLHIESEVSPAPAAGRAFQVTGIDDAGLTGFVRAADLKPRDSAPPQVWEVDDGTGAFSPNGDGRQDAITIAGRFSEAVNWRLTVKNGGGDVVGQDTGSVAESQFAASWDGRSGGSVVADGTYTWYLQGEDAWHNALATKTGTIRVDTVAPELASPLALASATMPVFSPNGDGKAETVSVGFTTNEKGAVDASIRTSGGTTVRTLSVSAGAGSGSLTWNGRNSSGSLVADGIYTVRMSPRDLAGNVGGRKDVAVGVYKSLSTVAASPTVFYPQDGDRLSPYTTLSFSLSRAATVTWQIRNASGTVVRTRYRDAALAAGTYTFRWYGTNDARTKLPAGTYVSSVRASDGSLGITHTTSVTMNAFRIRSSDTTPARGQTVTIYATSGEALKKAPLLSVFQPGITTWSVTMTNTTGRTYKAIVKLRSSSTGQLKLRVGGYDVDGHYQKSYLYLPLH
jgi:flagellar hook assembly protein FlgD